MKKWIVLVLFLLLTPVTFAGPPAAPPNGGDRTFDSVTTGTPNTTEGSEVTIREVMVENDAAEDIVAWKQTMELLDETDGTEDVIYREYLLVGGTLGLFRSTKIYAAEPTGSEAPVKNAIVWCNGTNWDCSDGADGIEQQCWYDGNSWEKLGDPAD